MIILFIFYKMNKYKVLFRLKIIIDKENELIRRIEDYNQFVDTFDNFYKNKTYQAGMSFLYLKKYQEELLKVLDPVFDKDMINNLQINIDSIEEILKELSFLSKNTIKIRKGKMVESLYFEEGVFSKN